VWLAPVEAGNVRAIVKDDERFRAMRVAVREALAACGERRIRSVITERLAISCSSTKLSG
jgi:hypothetical protein